MLVDLGNKKIVILEYLDLFLDLPVCMGYFPVMSALLEGVQIGVT
jgi:hypothetical protein